MARPVVDPRSHFDRARSVVEGLTPVQLTALVAVVALVAAGAYMTVGRNGSDGPPIETMLPRATTSSSTSTPPPVELLVHAAGAVREPGLQVVAAGARVADVVAAAGGLADDADPDRVNLAALVDDAERVYVPRVGEVVPVEVRPGAGGAEPPVVDINSATSSDLESLRGIGPAIAAAIIEHRQKVGSFASVESLLDVPGIGPAKLEGLRDAVTAQ